MKAKAFCPGHITGLFQVCEHEDGLTCGSRGAGLSISLGVISEVEVKEGTGKIDIWLNGLKAQAPVTEHAVRSLLGDRRLDVKVHNELQMPLAQGFGTSAAGSLSAAWALASLIDLPEGEAYAAAHSAEIVNRTGMGDVSGIMRGGIELRKKPGLPPIGDVQRMNGHMNLVLAIVGPSIPTAEMLGKKEVQEHINAVGERCVDGLMQEPTLDNFFRMSNEFMEGSGLSTPEVRRAVWEAKKWGWASQAMIGNSIFATGPDLTLLREALSAYGETFLCTLDVKGPRLL
ncbi:MAG: pantoate kinase [Methanomassiliicoccales archaeon]|nr:pantoate kinase [Methanomassiliicoccales archaeon]